MIEDVPVTVIRTLFRRAGLEGALTAGFVCDTLHVSEPKAATLLWAFVTAGLLEREKNGRWHLTTAGIRLRGATAAKPLLRRTAERLLDEFLQRSSVERGSSLPGSRREGNRIRQLPNRLGSVGQCRCGPFTLYRDR